MGPTEERLIQSLANDISDLLNSTGIFNRVFQRLKSSSSIEKKINNKKNQYDNNKKKMQDIFGIRVTVYFADDEELAINLLKNKYIELPDDHSIDKFDDDRFGPTRCNMIFRLPNVYSESSQVFNHTYIDNTFEVQFRTVFSEGWHEIEHDLRYKCKGDWVAENGLSRQLNRQFAVLQSCDWTLLKVFDELAYKKYKNSEWSSLFRNVVRIRFSNTDFSSEVKDYLNTNRKMAKNLLKIDRIKLLSSLSQLTLKIQFSMDLVLFVLNRIHFQNEGIKSLESEIVRQILDNSFSDEKRIFEQKTYIM